MEEYDTDWIMCDFQAFEGENEESTESSEYEFEKDKLVEEKKSIICEIAMRWDKSRMGFRPIKHPRPNP